MGANPHANGGLLSKNLVMPDFRDFGMEVPKPGAVDGEATRVLGKFLCDVMKLNAQIQNFRVMGPDETASNRLDALYEFTNKVWMEPLRRQDEYLARDGRVMEVLSEHMCQGWLEGYLLTGRHGFFSCYEAFIHIVDSMFNQHAKWLKVTRRIPWRRPIASLNYLLTSHVWRQDHNEFSHQDPGFIDHVVNKKAGVVRVGSGSIDSDDHALPLILGVHSDPIAVRILRNGFFHSRILPRGKEVTTKSGRKNRRIQPWHLTGRSRAKAAIFSHPFFAWET